MTLSTLHTYAGKTFLSRSWLDKNNAKDLLMQQNWYLYFQSRTTYEPRHKKTFGVWSQVRQKPACTATDTT